MQPPRWASRGPAGPDRGDAAGPAGLTDSIGSTVERRKCSRPIRVADVHCEEHAVSEARTPAVADPVVVPAGTTAADAVAAAGLPATGPKAIVVVRDPEGTAARPGLGARRPTRRSTPVRDRRAGRAQRAAPLHRARAGAGGAGPLPRGQARHRAADRQRLLLRLRRAQAVPSRGSRQAREADAGDHQVGPDVPAPPLRLAGRGQGRAGRRAVQARAGRHQGRRGRRPR